MLPFKTDLDGTPMFTNLQIQDYGMPELWGYEKYLICESREAVMVTDFKMESERSLQKTHRYCRRSRFKTCLLNLLGERGVIPESVMSMVRIYLRPDSKDKWNDTRKILKAFKQRKYYDNIPMILRKLNYQRLFPAITSEQLEELMNDFMFLSTKFEQTKTCRRYFPNIRFIVFKLLETHGIKPNYPIPFARTCRKLKSLSQLWANLCDQ